MSAVDGVAPVPEGSAAASSSLASRRKEYETAGLDAADLAADPIEQWQRWYDQAAEAGCVEPNAFVLSTVDAEGFPQSRYLLARGADVSGFVFFTNYDSAKSQQLEADGRVSMLFTWLQLHRQVRVTATAQRLPADQSDAYFATRPRSSQIGAWSSPQSQVLPHREALDQRVADMTRTFEQAEHVPRPVFWGGWLAQPVAFEFWQGRPSRLHDRLRYRRANSDGGAAAADAWIVERLAP